MDRLINRVTVEIRTVLPDCDTDLTDEITSAIKNSKLIKECVVYEKDGVIKVYVPDTL